MNQHAFAIAQRLLQEEHYALDLASPPIYSTVHDPTTATTTTTTATTATTATPRPVLPPSFHDNVGGGGPPVTSSPAAPPPPLPTTAPTRFLDLDTKDPRWIDLFMEHFISPKPSTLDTSPSRSVTTTTTTTTTTSSSPTHEAVDDLLFFVRYPHQSNAHLEPIFVKRKTGHHVPQLDDLIAWKESFLLNFLLQTPFSMSVSICSKKRRTRNKSSSYDAMAKSPSTDSLVKGSNASLSTSSSSPMVTRKRVTKHVYASPNKSRMDKKTSQNTVSYPVLYFCVNDFEDAFEGMVIEEHEYLCVELFTTVDLPAWAREQEDEDQEEATSGKVPTDESRNHAPQEDGHDDDGEDGSLHVTLFQGAVAYSALQEAYQSKTTSF